MAAELSMGNERLLVGTLVGFDLMPVRINSVLLPLSVRKNRTHMKRDYQNKTGNKTHSQAVTQTRDTHRDTTQG